MPKKLQAKARTEGAGRDGWDGDRIREVRERRSLTQMQLSEEAEVSLSDISRHENNRAGSNPTIAVLVRIARALHVPLATLAEPVGASIPGPDTEAGHAGQRERNQVFERMLEALDVEVPAEDSWRGDVLKAVAALNRALRRADPGAAPPLPAKAGR